MLTNAVEISVPNVVLKAFWIRFCDYKIGDFGDLSLEFSTINHTRQII